MRREDVSMIEIVTTIKEIMIEKFEVFTDNFKSFPIKLFNSFLKELEEIFSIKFEYFRLAHNRTVSEIAYAVYKKVYSLKN